VKIITSLAVACGLMSASFAYAAVDADAAQALLKKSDCFKCHAIDKKKDGPAYKEVAKKYKGKADAEDKLTKHITLKPMIEIDGKKEEHKAIKSTDAAEIKNVVQWMLAL
jgi:cytochrome c